MRENRGETREVIRNIPEPLAENVHPELAFAAKRLFEFKRSPADWLKAAWYYAEIGLNSGVDNPAARQEYFRESESFLSMVIQRPGAHNDLVLGALTLSTYMPVLRKRAEEQPIQAQDCDEVYRSLGMAITHLTLPSQYPSPQWRMTEVGVLALSARTRQPDLLLYPTSPREEMSDIQTLNHDSYFFAGSDKIPLQQKLLPTAKQYDEGITILTLMPLVEKALRISGDSNDDDMASKVKYLHALIAAEATTQDLSRDDLRFLNFMSEAVVAHRYKFTGKEPLFEDVA